MVLIGPVLAQGARVLTACSASRRRGGIQPRGGDLRVEIPLPAPDPLRRPRPTAEHT